MVHSIGQPQLVIRKQEKQGDAAHEGQIPRTNALIENGAVNGFGEQMKKKHKYQINNRKKVPNQAVRNYVI